MAGGLKVRQTYSFLFAGSWCRSCDDFVHLLNVCSEHS
jgi:hypothetical protein